MGVATLAFRCQINMGPYGKKFSETSFLYYLVSGYLIHMTNSLDRIFLGSEKKIRHLRRLINIFFYVIKKLLNIRKRSHAF